jgi:hypothetical protein
MKNQRKEGNYANSKKYLCSQKDKDAKSYRLWDLQ